MSTFVYEIDFEVQVEAPGRSPEAFMEYVDECLYERYSGDLSPLVRDGRYLVSATVEAEALKFSDAILPVLRHLESIGLHIRGFEIVNTLEPA